MLTRRNALSALALGVVGVSIAPTALADGVSVDVSTQDGPYTHEVVIPVVLRSPGGDPDKPIMVVPGDEVSGIAHVKNSGSSAGTMHVYLLKPETTSPDSQEDPWFTDLKINDKSVNNWIEQAKDIGGYEGVEIDSRKIAPGEVADYTLNAVFAFEDESGNRAGSNATTSEYKPNEYTPGSRQAHVDLLVRIDGQPKKSLAKTGADALSLLGIAGAASVAGAGFMLSRRKNDSE
ncbi:LPXTG cell wall anchor domain-containing protein [Actinomyces vulturis]|uniref:LPXTG cell wall anchor domain-containing protein n=1 Tax=Actinomyces vulturis TaxID=1857645 RepID=UPI0008375996|nr:LPXTG cell wall anchor domain-containing protein [Actinomyces vulturis]